MQGRLLQQSYILQFDEDELGLRIAALEQAADELFTALSNDVLEYELCLRFGIDRQRSLLNAATVRNIAINEKTKTIIHKLIPTLKYQIKALSNRIRVLRLEILFQQVWQ